MSDDEAADAAVRAWSEVEASIMDTVKSILMRCASPSEACYGAMGGIRTLGRLIHAITVDAPGSRLLIEEKAIGFLRDAIQGKETTKAKLRRAPERKATARRKSTERPTGRGGDPVPHLSAAELLETEAEAAEDLDDADDMPPFGVRVERLRRAALRPFPQSKFFRAVRSARPEGRLRGR